MFYGKYNKLKDMIRQQNTQQQGLWERYRTTRTQTERICQPLATEDFVVQPVEFVSPPKWHLGHTTWFFETFILRPHHKKYRPFNENFDFVFNSYYESLGARVIRTDRGNLSRPTVNQIYDYRHYVDQQMQAFLQSSMLSRELFHLIELGLNHEQQHQELLWTDIKYILGHNPLFPAYSTQNPIERPCHSGTDKKIVNLPAGLYDIGYTGEGFCFDNELGRHTVFLEDFGIANELVSNGEYLDFILDDGYVNFKHWHAQGWDWVREHRIGAPLYWHRIDGEWFHYTLSGLKKLDLTCPVAHVSYYEAAAYALWKSARLASEAEWEVAAEHLNWGQRWEWTASAYQAYPRFKKSAGAIGEYNGKFMVNQQVLRGSSVATPTGHSRTSYRNFFHAPLRWQFTGIRLAF